MLFYCCLVHPSIMIRVASTGNKIVYNTEDPTCQAYEDYELWFRLIHSPQQAPTFANIGTALLYLRKHANSTSSMALNVSVENEIPMKVQVLTNYFIQGELREQLR